MKGKSLFNRVAIKPDNPEVKTKGGIILPDTVQDKKGIIGTVFSAGIDCKVLKKGDRVYYNRHGGQIVPLKDKKGQPYDLYVFLEQEILYLIEDEEIEGIEGVDYEIVEVDESETSAISFVPTEINNHVLTSVDEDAWKELVHFSETGEHVERSFEEDVKVVGERIKKALKEHKDSL
jgi:co-chaperonin GroES (HSP10)